MKPETIRKFIDLENQLSKEKGKFVLFALFEREEAKNKWDVVISASWLGDDFRRWDDLVERIRRRLEPSELSKLSRVVILEPYDGVVESVTSSFQVEHKNVEVRDYDFHGIPVEHAHIITSNRYAKPRPKNSTYHVTPDSESGWVVKRAGADRASGRFNTKQEAIDYARELATVRNLIVHGRDGRIQRSESLD